MLENLEITFNLENRSKLLVISEKVEVVRMRCHIEACSAMIWMSKCKRSFICLRKTS